ncbi:hypothetical protein [Flavobacterium sp.]|uniref:hypothetical protein n=1 Tax=Flavobacterium sp. TaxID=239 RepID=UPI00286FAA4B|nr:hypothetical protein [Flavobacterium sp.]
MNTNTILLLILSVLIAAGFAYFHYLYKAKNKSNLNLFLAFLRFLALFSIFLLLINPTITSNTLEIQKTPLVVVMDNSSSIPFLKSDKTANEFYQKIVSNTDLQEKFDIQSYQFDTDFLPSKSFTFKGKQSHIDAVAKGLQTTFKNKTFPTVLLTDGNQTTGNDYVYSFNAANKVYPVILGDTTQVFDLKINQLNVNQYVFHKNKFPVEGFIQYSGTQPITANFIISEGKSILVQQPISLSTQKRIAVVQLVLPANKLGLQVLKAQITSPKEEKNKFNNSKNFAVEVLNQKTNIAIISSLNHPDIGALKRSIESNVQRKVSVFKPNTISDLRKYNVVIFYQPNSTFKAAFEASKSLGLNAFIITGTATDYSFLNQQQTDLQFKMGNQTEDYFAGFNSQFNVFALDNIGFESFPPLQNNFGTISSRGNVSVLLSSTIRGIDTQSPLLAFTENQGKRTAFLLGENSWKWRSQSFVDHQSFEKYDIFIDKIIQFLASNPTKKPLVVEHELVYNSGDKIEINAQYFNKNFEFDEKARLNIAIINKQTKAVTNFDLLKGSNSYKVNLDGLPAGKYNFTVTELNSKEQYSNYFEILDFDIEKQFVNPNFQKLQQLATQTQGKVYLPNQSADLIQQLLKNEDYKAIQKNVITQNALIDWSYLLVIIAFLLTTEWLVRKYNGLL